MQFEKTNPKKIISSSSLPNTPIKQTNPKNPSDSDFTPTEEEKDKRKR